MADILVEWKNCQTKFHKADAQKCYEEIGSTDVTPQRVLDIAKDESTELHKCFEWDDSVASEKYRLIQASSIIRSLIIKPVDNSPSEPVRVFQISSESKVYQPTTLFLEQPDEYEILLKRAKSELIAIRNRYRQLSELESVFEAIDNL